MAYKDAAKLLRAVRASGLPYTEVAGWQNRGRGTMGTIHTITCHHTATPRKLRPADDYPTMNVVKNGRAGIPGPLAQLGLGRSGRVYLIAAGRANHAGRSKNTAMTNSHAIGIEAEGAMEAWPDRQYSAYVRLVAALASEYPGAQILGHKETAAPAGRKNDPSFSMSAFRRAVAVARRSPASPPQKTNDTHEQEKGLFGMSDNEQYARVGDQRVPARSKTRLRMHPASREHQGPHYIARPRRRGQLFQLSASVTFAGVPAGADVKAQIIVARNRGGIWFFERPFEEVSVPAGIDGWAAVELNQPDKFGFNLGQGESAEYQVEITNHSAVDLTVKRVRSSCHYA